MKKAVLVLLVLCMVMSCLPLTALADDATLGGTGITVYPIDDTKVVMEKEIIDITVKDGKTYVNCQFYFHNTGGKTTLLVGFPTMNPGWNGYDEESDEDMPDDYIDDEALDGLQGDLNTELYRFRTFIHGKRVPVKIAEGLKPEGNNSDGLYFPKWYTWEMTFTADERVKVVNRYYMENSLGGENSEWTNYILRSGSTWSGHIGSVTVRMKFEGYDMFGVMFDEMRPTYIEKDGTVVWEAKDIEPKEDISAVFESPGEFEYMEIPFEDSTNEYYLYDNMGTRMLRNFNIKHYNGTTWWGNKMIKEFGDKQSAEFYYVMGVSYYKLGRYQKALDMLKLAQTDEWYGMPALYYEALVYRKTGNDQKYIACLNDMVEYYSRLESDMEDYVYWGLLWAQSRLNDLGLGESC